MTVGERFDRWVGAGPFTPEDLGIYRIVYALSALFIVPDISWVHQFPGFTFQAPPGPLQLLPGIPSPTALIVIEVLRTVALVALALGLWTRYASIAAFVMLTLTYGVVYCLGKIDHTILVVLAPLVLAFANWGDRFSLDALRRWGAAEPGHEAPQQLLLQEQWPLRLWALLIGWGFFVAAVTKILTGWLSPASQAARGYFLLEYLTEGRTHWLAPWLASHDVRAAWEVVDWLTVIFEAAILIALPWWRFFRLALAIAAVFHLVVLLIMNIDFSHAVIAYGAFVSWGSAARRFGASPLGRSVRDLIPPAGPQLYAGLGLLGIAIGCGAWFLMVNPVGKISTGPISSHVIIVVGAVIGFGYLIRESRTALGRPAPREALKAR